LNDTEVRKIYRWEKRKLLAQVAREYQLAQRADLFKVSKGLWFSLVHALELYMSSL
jgi:hypothetical protein